MRITVPLTDVAPGLRRWTSETLRGWSGTLDGATVAPGAGRGTVTRARVGERWAIVRTYRRGGLLASLLPDRFLGAGRALAEIRALERLAALGLAPRPLVLEVRGAWALRLRIAVEEAPGASNLLERARGRVLDVATARRVGRLVREMHDAGVSHRDLHVGNLLVEPDGGRALVVDLDGARCYDGGVPQARREREVLRLCRSLEKWPATSATLAPARAAFLRASLPRGRRRAVLAAARRRSATRRWLGALVGRKSID